MKKSILRLGAQWLVLLLLLASRSAGPLHAQSADDANFMATVGQLRDASFVDKDKLVDQLSQSSHPGVQAVLTALLEDRLYFRNDDQKVVILKTAIAEDVTTADLIDPITLKGAGSTAIDGLTKIGTNNHLRKTLHTVLARFKLTSPDASVRLSAARDMEQDLDEGNVKLLHDRVGVETDSAVKKELETGLALAALDNSDPGSRLSAISTLRHSLRQERAK